MKSTERLENICIAKPPAKLVTTTNEKDSHLPKSHLAKTYTLAISSIQNVIRITHAITVLFFENISP